MKAPTTMFQRLGLAALLWLCTSAAPAGFDRCPDAEIDSLKPDTYEVGDDAKTAKVKVHNKSKQSTRFRIVLKSAPSGWDVTVIEVGTKFIESDEKDEFEVRITPPAFPDEDSSIRFLVLSYIDNVIECETADVAVPVTALPEPGSFSPIFPPRNGSGITVPFLFTWEPSEFAESYTIKLYDDDGTQRVDPPFATIDDIDGLAYQYDEDPALEPGRAYWWSVTAENDVGSTGNNGGAVLFELAPAPAPTAFDWVTPAFPDEPLPDQPVFRWTPSQNATSFTVKVFDDEEGDPAPTPKLTRTGVIGNSFTYPVALDPGHYWALVTAVGQGGRTRDVTGGARRFDITHLGEFSLRTPAHGTEFVSRNPTFTWTQCPGAFSYVLELYQLYDSGQRRLVQRASVPFESFTYTGPEALAPNQTYTWHVLAAAPGEDRQNVEGFINFRETPITAPVPLSPAANSTGNSTTPVFRWTSYSLDVVARRQAVFFVQLAGSVEGRPDLDSPYPFTGGETDQLSQASQFAELRLDTPYYYRVAMKDIAANIVASDWVPFRTTDIPDFQVVYPFDGAVSVATEPTIQWSAAAPATEFLLHFAAEGLGSLPVIVANTDSQYTLSPAEHLNGATNYSMTVEARTASSVRFARLPVTFTTAPRDTATADDVLDAVLGRQVLSQAERDALGSAAPDGLLDVATYLRMTTTP